MRRAKEATAQGMRREVDWAFRMRPTYGEERQRMIEGEGSSITGASQEDEWGDDMDEDIDLEKASISGSASGKSPRGRRLMAEWKLADEIYAFASGLTY